MKKNVSNSPLHLKVLSTRESKLVFSICALLIIGIFFSKALITISMVGLVIVSLRYISWEKITAFFNDLTMMPLLLVFMVVFLSGGYSENHEAWMTALRVKLPFLILPFVIYVLPRMKKDFVIYLHFWLIIVSLVVGAIVSINVVLDYKEMISLLAKGQAIPTPIEHVKYSMFNAYAAMSGIILWREGRHSNTHQLWLLRIATVSIVILLHVLAVRTGLIIFYISALTYLGLKTFREGDKRKLIVFIASSFIIPIVALNTIPSLQQKIAYMKYDWANYREGNGEHYSDSERIMSYKAGWEIWKSNPILGAGYGDVREDAHLYYDAKYKRSNFFKLPHSQFLLTMAGSGILGLLIFIAGFFTPLLVLRDRSVSTILLFYLYLNYTLSFLVENSLERSISVAFFLVFALFLLKSINEKRKLS